MKIGNWPDPARKRLRVALLSLGIIAGSLSAPQVAEAHADPWTTHWHYDAWGNRTYKMCSWVDATFFGCRGGF